MIHQLLKIVQQNSENVVVKNTAIPNQYNQGVQEELTNTILNSLSNMAAKGNVTDVVQLFGNAASGGTNNLSSNPMIGAISQNIVASLGKKYNIAPEVSNNIIRELLPTVLGQFSKQVADPKDKSIDMNTVIGALLGGAKGNASKPAGGVDFNTVLTQVLTNKGGGGLDIGKIAGAFLGGGATQKPATTKAGSAKSKSNSSGKKVTPAKNTTKAKGTTGKDILGGLLNNLLK